MKLVILSASIGTGHVRAAEAIEKTAKQDFPELGVIHLDVMDYIPKIYRHLYADSYIKIVNNYPALWEFMYQKSDKVKDISSKIKKLRNTKKLKKKLSEIQPDYIICTHCLPTELISYMTYKGEINIPFWAQITDFYVHALWIHTNAAGYFVGNHEVAWRLQKSGISPNKIHVTGIPVSSHFSPNLSRIECATELGISAHKPTLLLMSGGFGVTRVYKLTKALLELDLDVQVIALAGKNKQLLNRLQKLSAKFDQLKPMAFTNKIEHVMAASDIAISKPGGLTSAECLAMNLPLIVVSPIPGQEERNANYLLESGAAVKAYDMIGLQFRLKELLEDKNNLEKIQQNMQTIAKPNAARDVLNIIRRRNDAR
jgi:processive 1,2-diacylglycerol beta-glucosyltransferase